MAHFRGVVQGQRGDASRLGSAKSGLTVVAQAWGGQVVTRLWQDGHGRDFVRVYVEANSAAYGDTAEDVTLYYGPLDSLRNGNTFADSHTGRIHAKQDAEGNYL